MTDAQEKSAAIDLVNRNDSSMKVQIGGTDVDSTTAVKTAVISNI